MEQANTTRGNNKGKGIVYILVHDPTGKPAFHVILPQYPDKQAHALPGFLFEFATLHSGFCVADTS